MGHTILFFLASLVTALQSRPFSAPTTTQLLEERAASEVPSWPITFYFENRQEALPITLFDDRDAESVSRDGLSQLTHHVRCFRTDRERPIHPRLAEIVARVAEAFGRDQVNVVSGYRARPYGAPHSKHFLGRAMDLQLPGVPARKIAAWVWKNFRGVGVGYYPKQDFVHIDVRDLDVRWVDTSTHGESAHARYFARKAGDALAENAPELVYDCSRAEPQVALVPPSSSPLASLAGGFRGRD